MAGIYNLHSPTLPSSILHASSVTNVPTFVLAGMFQSGFTGDPLALGYTLEKWYNATGGTSWDNALAAYHAGSVKGVLDPHAQSYARSVTLSAQNAPQLIGAQPIGQVLGLAGAELAGGILAVAGAASLPVDAGLAAAGGTDAGATAATGAAGGTAGAVTKGALSGAGSTAAKVGLAGLLGATGWAEFGVRMIEALAGAALLLLGLQALTGGTGDPIQAVKHTARRMR